jgi:hypothetical protein
MFAVADPLQEATTNTKPMNAPIIATRRGKPVSINQGGATDCD